MERYFGRGVGVRSTLDPFFDLAFSGPQSSRDDYFSFVHRPAPHLLLQWSWTGKDVFKCELKEVWQPSNRGD